jgi:hypothetical protein
VCSFDFLELVPRRADTHDTLYLLCKEGVRALAMETHHEHRQIVNRFIVGALVATEPVLSVIRRELRRLAPDARVTVEEIEALLPDVLKRDLLEGDAALQAKKRVSRTAGRPLRKLSQGEAAASTDAEPKPAGGAEAGTELVEQ